MIDSKKYKILLCSPIVGTGGISSWTKHILEYYKSHQYEDKIILKWSYATKSKKGQITGEKTNLSRLFGGISNYLPFIKELKRELKSTKYDVVHFCSSASIALLRDIVALTICRKKKVKTIVHFRFGRIPELFKANNWECKLLKKVITLATTIILIDEASYNALLFAGYKNIILLPNILGPNVQKFIESNTEVKRIPNKLVFAGHVVRTKGVYELVEACKQIKGVQLNILGIVKDDVKKQLQELAGETHDEWLNIRGNQTLDDVIAEMKSANIFVLPTYTEGFPNVIIESMACGCPIVTTPVGAIPEMLDINTDNPCGICVDVKNVNQLKEKIEYLLNNPEISKDMGERAKAKVYKMYSIDIVWKNLVKIWKS